MASADFTVMCCVGAGNIHGAMDVDMTAAMAYIANARQQSQERVTVTTLVVKAVALVSAAPRSGCKHFACG